MGTMASGVLGFVWPRCGLLWLLESPKLGLAHYPPCSKPGKEHLLGLQRWEIRMRHSGQDQGLTHSLGSGASRSLRVACRGSELLGHHKKCTLLGREKFQFITNFVTRKSKDWGRISNLSRKNKLDALERILQMFGFSLEEEKGERPWFKMGINPLGFHRVLSLKGTQSPTPTPVKKRKTFSDEENKDTESYYFNSF